MKTTSKIQKMGVLICAIIICASSFAQEYESLPVTTTSSEALKIYNESLTLREKGYIQKSMEMLNKAVAADPDFFMAHFQMGIVYYYYNDDVNFKKSAGRAIAINVNLNPAEEIYKQILERYLKDKKSDVTDLGAKIIELYPKDYYSHLYQAYFCSFAGKKEESIQNMENALELTDHKAPVYNTLGYFYMEANRMAEAEQAFDKYIELDPDEANPYDSKGDYYMAVKEYQKAYDSFMKAYQLDNSFAASLKKAEKARQMLESK